MTHHISQQQQEWLTTSFRDLHNEARQPQTARPALPSYCTTEHLHYQTELNELNNYGTESDGTRTAATHTETPVSTRE